ncbi:MAG TPA: SusC/RagA family TonB-linked outer membrane protein [Prolixibacteraceae bacterium]|jgi:TonB-linked SusC/RagA family outer membrane protein|nr:SusC/RagA family TonB-linked outer membrane protein [Prolixibacteraceae bacterium]
MKKIIRFSGLLIIVLLSGFCNLYAQKSAIIKGHITDALTKSSMEFVNVVEIDKNGRFVSGTISDLNGNYIIKVSNDKNPLQASFIGYHKQNIDINGRTQIDIKLVSDDQTLSEVTISGTKMSNDGFTKVRDRATAVARIDMKDMKSLMSTSVEDLLQGRMGNVDISSISGDPGAGLNIRIRGTATLNARNNPLIVINGIPYDAAIDPDFDFASADVEKFGNLIDVSPEDIETIEVLKDASSTAAWGSRASNGVLMIKTKRGVKSKPIFEYTYKNTIAKEPAPIPMLDGPGYARLISEEKYNVDRNNFSTTPEFREISFNPASWDGASVNMYNNYSQNTDWVKEITQIAHTKQHDFSVRGGGEKSRYNMSVGFFDESGTTINNGLKKLNLRSSLDYDLSSKLQFKSDIMFTRYDQHNTYDAEDGDFKDKLVRSIAYKRMPNLSVMYRDTDNISYGEYFTPPQTLQASANDNYNPVSFATLGQNRQLKDNARALFTVRYNITENLIYNSTVTLDIFDNKREKYLPYQAIGYDYYGNLSNRSTNEFTKKSSIYTINQFIYSPKLGEAHDLALMGQFDTEETIQRGLFLATSQSASPLIQQPTGDKHLVGGDNFKSNYSKYRSMGFFGNVSYKYKDKYIFQGGVKYEGNSKYSPESRWGFFPTVSTAWRINKENFLKDVKFIDDLKLRLSWGRSGNAPDQQYLYFNTYEAGSSFSYLDMQGVKPKNMELTSLKWETIDQINPGLSFFGLNNRLNIEFDYYQKKTLDLYLKDSGIPTTSGFGGFNQNNGELENRGSEFSIDYTVLEKRDFKLKLNVNISNNKNVVISLPANYSLVYGDMLENGHYKISITPGEPIGGFFGYHYLGVYKDDEDAVVRDKNGDPIYGLNKNVPLKMIMGGTSGYVFEGGDAKYEDVNHDGKIDELDLVYLGDLNPKLMGGFGQNVQYKGFVLNTFFYFKVGQKIINQTRMDTENMYGFDNQSKATNWRWRSAGDDTDMPRALYNKGFNWLGSSRFVEDGSYLRLKTVSLTYNFKESFAHKLKVKDLKIYTTVYNVYTWTKYSGQDPDVSQPSKPDELPIDRSRTPPSRKLLFGINVTF